MPLKHFLETPEWYLRVGWHCWVLTHGSVDSDSLFRLTPQEGR